MPRTKMPFEDRVEELECKSQNIEFYSFDFYFDLLMWECMND